MNTVLVVIALSAASEGFRIENSKLEGKLPKLVR